MKKIKESSKLGIWGFGIVGKSALRFFKDKHFIIEVFDSRVFTDEEHNLIQTAQASVVDDLSAFLKTNHFIVPSPGIDLRPYKKYASKWLPELDIIQNSFSKPVIAITGTAGKTTVTHLLSEFLKSYGLRVWTGGNIGSGMLDLVREQENIDLAVLEVSSFQLEFCKTFAPTIAIWTNFFPNHLDRHATMEEYFRVKKNILRRQTSKQHAVIATSILKNLKEVKSSLHIIEPEKKLPNFMKPFEKFTFKENLVAIALALKLALKELGYKRCQKINIDKGVIRLPSHRLEYLGAKNGVTFYNDSKSTTPASTLAAVKKLSGKSILLLLGGLGKGTNREELIVDIKMFVKKVYAFGAESEIIYTACKKNNIPCAQFKTLEPAVAQTVQDAQIGDQILLSPGGSSFDLFKNYEERGNSFKLLVEQHTAKKTTPF